MCDITNSNVKEHSFYPKLCDAMPFVKNPLQPVRGLRCHVCFVVHSNGKSAPETSRCVRGVSEGPAWAPGYLGGHQGKIKCDLITLNIMLYDLHGGN